MDKSIDELIEEAVGYPDWDNALVVVPAGEDPGSGIHVCRYDGTRGVTAGSLKEALELYIRENSG